MGTPHSSSLPVLSPFYYSSSSILLYCLPISYLSLYSHTFHLPSLSFNLSSPTPFSNSSPLTLIPFSFLLHFLSFSFTSPSSTSYYFLLHSLLSLASTTSYPPLFLLPSSSLSPDISSILLFLLPLFLMPSITSFSFSLLLPSHMHKH